MTAIRKRFIHLYLLFIYILNWLNNKYFWFDFSNHIIMLYMQFRWVCTFFFCHNISLLAVVFSRLKVTPVMFLSCSISFPLSSRFFFSSHLVTRAYDSISHVQLRLSDRSVGFKTVSFVFAMRMILSCHFDRSIYLLVL